MKRITGFGEPNGCGRAALPGPGAAESPQKPVVQRPPQFGGRHASANVCILVIGRPLYP